MEYPVYFDATSKEIGAATAWIRYSYATGEVTGGDFTGGLVGRNRAGSHSSAEEGHLRYSYATGSVTGKDNVGGLVGTLTGDLWRSYSTGRVTGDSAVGGLIGHTDSSRNRIVQSYWDTATSGVTASAGGEGKTTAQLQSPTGTTGIYSEWWDQRWDFGTSGQYPVLETDMDGDGTATWQEFGPQGRPQSLQPALATRSPQPTGRPVQRPLPNGRYDPDGDGLIEIQYLEQLDGVRYDADGDGTAGQPGYGGSASRESRAAYAAAFPTSPGQPICDQDCYGFELTRSLDFDDPGSYRSGRVNATWSNGREEWVGISISGTFDGNGHTVNLRSSTRLFGAIGGNGVVTSVGVLNAQADWGGAFATANFGEISRSYSTGSVTGLNYLGGFVGVNLGGVIRDSYSTAPVRASGRNSRVISGLAGHNQAGMITHSCAHGDVWLDPEYYVDASWPTGGLVGLNGGPVVYGCATGDVRGHTSVGGLVGLGDASHSYATGNVTGTDRVGGLVGSGKVAHGYATGNVTGGGYWTGGLAGFSGDISAGYATGDVRGRVARIGYSDAGGLVGVNLGHVVAGYSTGSASNASRVGGLSGSIGATDLGTHTETGSVKASYSTADVFGGTFRGGLLGGASENTVHNSYWDTTIFTEGVGTGNDTGAEGLTTAEMQSPTGYTGVYASWNTDLDNADNDNDPSTGADDYWDFGTNSQYPALKADMDGDGIATAAEFGGQGRGEEQPTTTPTPPPATPPHPTTPPPNGRYDQDGDRLIEISNLEQLNAIQYDKTVGRTGGIFIDGDGIPLDGEETAAYSSAFPTGEGESVCIERCHGYELTRSLDFRSPGSYALGAVNAAWTSGEGWEPIHPDFVADFEGNEYTISNLYINRPEEDHAGLFYRIFSGSVHGVGLVDVDIRVKENVGAVAGALRGYKPSVSHSYATGSVSGSSEVGGLAGFVFATRGPVNISDTSFTGTVSSSGEATEAPVGGLVGKFRVDTRQTRGSIRRSHTAGTVSGGNSWCAVGGLVGENGGHIIASSSTADVTCSGAAIAGNAGGLLGSHRDGIVKSSFATGNVRAVRYAGGLVGYNVPGTATIAGSYATGDVTALAGTERAAQFGGLVGQQYGNVSSTYATGSVSADTTVGGLIGYGGSNTGHVRDSYSIGHVSGDSGTGGLVGYADFGSYSQNYWNTQTSGQDYGTGQADPHFAQDPTGVQGKTTAELQAPTGYTGIYEYWNLQGDDLWDFGTGSNYPVLKADMNADGVATWQEFGGQRGNEPSTQWQAREQPCDRTISGDSTYNGIWTGDCVSAEPARKGLSPKARRKIPRAPFTSRSIPKPLSSRITARPPSFSSTLPPSSGSCWCRPH